MGIAQSHGVRHTISRPILVFDLHFSVLSIHCGGSTVISMAIRLVHCLSRVPSPAVERAQIRVTS